MVEPTETERRAPTAHPAKVPWRESYPLFATIMRRLIGSDSPRDIAAAIGTVTAHNVRDWRRGRCGIPQWVLDWTRQREAKARQDTDTRLAMIEPAPGKLGDIAAKMRAKNKARQPAGL